MWNYNKPTSFERYLLNEDSSKRIKESKILGYNYPSLLFKI